MQRKLGTELQGVAREPPATKLVLFPFCNHVRGLGFGVWGFGFSVLVSCGVYSWIQGYWVRWVGQLFRVSGHVLWLQGNAKGPSKF